MYETVSDLATKNIDTQQLLGLIKNNEELNETEDEFAYEDDSEAEDGKQVHEHIMLVTKWNIIVIARLIKVKDFLKLHKCTKYNHKNKVIWLVDKINKHIYSYSEVGIY